MLAPIRFLMWSALALAIVLPSAAPARADDNPYRTQLDAGWKAYNTDDDTAAMKIALDILSKDPKNAEAYSLRGSVYWDLHQLDKAYQDQQTAVKLDHGYDWPWRQMCGIDIDRDNSQQAVSDCSKYIETNPRDGYTRRQRALAYDDLERYTDALDDANIAVTVDQQNPWGYEYRCYIYRDMEKHDEALADCQKAFDLSPSNQTQVENLGLAMVDDLKYKEAIAFLTAQRAKLTKPSGALYDALARAYHAVNDDANALQSVNAGIAIDPNNGYYYWRRAQIEAALKQTDAAIADAKKAERLAIDAQNNYLAGEADKLLQQLNP